MLPRSCGVSWVVAVCCLSPRASKQVDDLFRKCRLNAVLAFANGQRATLSHANPAISATGSHTFAGYCALNALYVSVETWCFKRKKCRSCDAEQLRTSSGRSCRTCRRRKNTGNARRKCPRARTSFLDALSACLCKQCRVTPPSYALVHGSFFRTNCSRRNVVVLKTRNDPDCCNSTGG